MSGVTTVIKKRSLADEVLIKVGADACCMCAASAQESAVPRVEDFEDQGTAAAEASTQNEAAAQPEADKKLLQETAKEMGLGDVEDERGAKEQGAANTKQKVEESKIAASTHSEKLSIDSVPVEVQEKDEKETKEADDDDVNEDPGKGLKQHHGDIGSIPQKCEAEAQDADVMPHLQGEVCFNALSTALSAQEQQRLKEEQEDLDEEAATLFPISDLVCPSCLALAESVADGQDECMRCGIKKVLSLRVCVCVCVCFCTACAHACVPVRLEVSFRLRVRTYALFPHTCMQCGKLSV